MGIWETLGEQVSFPGKCKTFTSNGWLLSKVDFLIVLFLSELFAFQQGKINSRFPNEIKEMYLGCLPCCSYKTAVCIVGFVNPSSLLVLCWLQNASQPLPLAECSSSVTEAQWVCANSPARPKHSIYNLSESRICCHCHRVSGVACYCYWKCQVTKFMVCLQSGEWYLIWVVWEMNDLRRCHCYLCICLAPIFKYQNLHAFVK